MYLNTLSYRGLKSYAQHTVFRFEPGITAVVGPNGSGKSNVVDALAWVMGEQGAKSLRGGSMSDVIFAGTSGRPALGRAQVELTIDNSDGRLPIDYSEVTISRTIFRSGGSEYTINGSQVRLLDVQELLSDTGMGKQMHVIVGQGQLDAVLRASAEERRGFIDEAAGVLKHRRRKERALRKLASMDGDLLRVLDLTEEIKRQLRPLARQAKAAQAVRGVTDRIALLSRHIAADQLEEAARRYQRDAAELAKLSKLSVGLEQQIEDAAAVVASAGEKSTTLAADHRAYSALWHQFDALVERLGGLVSLSGERLAAAQPRGAAVTESAIELATANAAEAGEQAEAARIAAEQQRELTAVAAESQRSAAERETAAQTALRQKETQLERLRAAQQQRREAAASAQSAVVVVQDSLGAAGERLVRAQAAQAELVARTAELLADGPVSAASASGVDGPVPGGPKGGEPSSDEPSSEELGSGDSGAPGAVAPELPADRHQRLTDQLRKLRGDLERQQAALSSAQAELARAGARRDALAQSLPAPAEQPAVAGSAESAPGAPGSAPAPGQWRRLASVDQLVRVAPGWERAISALLEPFDAAAIVARTDSPAAGLAQAADAEEPLRALRIDASDAESGSGELAARWPGDLATRAADAGQSGPAEACDATEGASGPLLAVDAASIDPRVAAAIMPWLTGAALVATLPDAEQALSDDPSLLAAVTAEGVVLTRTSIRGPGQQTPPALLLRSQWEEAGAEAAAGERRLAELRQLVAQTKDRLQRTDAAAVQALAELRAADAAEAERQRQRATATAQLDSAASEVSRSERAVADLRDRLVNAEQQAAAAAAAIDAEPVADAEHFLAPERAAVAGATAHLRDAAETYTERRLAAQSAEETLRTARRAADSLAAHAKTLHQTRLAQIREKERMSDMRRRLERVLERAQAAHLEAHELAGVARRLAEGAARRLDAAGARARELSAELDNLRWSASNQSAARQQAELAQVQSRLALEQALATARDLLADQAAEDSADGASPGEVGGFPDESAPTPGDPVRDAADHQLGADSQVADDLAGQLDEPAISTFLTAHGQAVPVPDEAGDPQPYTRQQALAWRTTAERRLARFGVVNPLAEQEFLALEQRYTFLTEQVTDLQRSKADLLQIIAEVDQRVQEAFTEAFADISAAYERVFAALFPGGRGHLSLTDPDDPLTTGVEIYARPAGKRVTRLSLLSGGERSLAALAYLVAIFQARPSPFYVMDEVEAALDDVNVSRVLQVFEQLRASSQLIVVTHQKRTMEIADALYGVTMRSGVSVVASHRMER